MPAMTLLESPSPHDKPLPAPPSPTLSNIDLVLPTSTQSPGSNRPGWSPTSVRPSAASASAIRGFTLARQASQRERQAMTPVGYSPSVNRSQEHAREWAGPWNVPSSSASTVTDDDDDATERGSVGSNRRTTLQSSPPMGPNQTANGLLALPPQPDKRRGSSGSVSGASSFNSDESFKRMPNFMAKYQAHIDAQNSSEDEKWERESTATTDIANVSVIEDGIEMQRRIQEEDEHASAVLSKRAELILANAKKRLNLMEGNLRGARDLVQPLTAANLRRATSLYVDRSEVDHSNIDAASAAQSRPYPSLQAKGSSPAIGRDYTNHTRGYSANEAQSYPDRPHTAMARTISMSRRIPVKVSTEQLSSHSLRGARSHDALSIVSRERGLGSKNSTESPPLDTLRENEIHDGRSSSTSGSVRRLYAGLSRKVSTPDDLRSQLSSLQGKISSLRQRAEEDRMRRKSSLSLQSTTPFNNAADEPPEFYYTHNTSGEDTVADTSVVAGQSHIEEQPASTPWQPTHARTGSRNAFAEAAAVAASDQPNIQHDVNGMNGTPRPQALHQRTPSGTVVISTGANRFSHHAATHVVHAPFNARAPSIINSETDGDTASEAGESVYEDAMDGTDDDDESDTQSLYTAESNVVAHEERPDAFDYQQFWMHSTIGTYGSRRRESNSSEDSVSSSGTARGPTAPAIAVEDEDEEDTFFDGPHTPERLRRIERGYRHRRNNSNGSTGTTATFATAMEGPSRTGSSMSWRMRSPPTSRPSTALDRPLIRPVSILPRPSTAQDHSRERPKTAVQRPAITKTDSDSDRADSGVGFSKQQNKKPDGIKESTLHTRPSNSYLITPPVSPTDPTTKAVHSLLDLSKGSLGLKEKALLFSVVDSLRKVCSDLQEEDSSSAASQIMRKKLEDVKMILDSHTT